MKNSIHIAKPYIESKPDVDRINCVIDENGKKHTLYAEVEKEYGKYLCTERSDAYVCLMLPIALREGYDIYCEAPVTEQLLHNLQEILIPHLCLGDDRLHEIKIHAETDNTPLGGDAVGTAVSCGVDSLYTIKEYSVDTYPSMKLTHLFIAPANKELWTSLRHDTNLEEWIASNESQFERMDVVAEALDVPLVKMFTNYVYYLCKNGRGMQMYKHVYLHFFLTMAMVLTLKKLWRIYYFSSAQPFTSFSLTDNATHPSGHYDLLNAHALTTPDLSIFIGGAKADRVKKTIELLDFDVANEVLHPCHTTDENNCSEPTCSKCLRALLTYDAYDRLDDAPALFDVGKYRNNKEEYMKAMVAHKGNAYMKDLYAIFCEKYPEQMAKVGADVESEKAAKLKTKTKAAVKGSPKVSKARSFLSKVKRKLT